MALRFFHQMTDRLSNLARFIAASVAKRLYIVIEINTFCCSLNEDIGINKFILGLLLLEHQVRLLFIYLL